MMTGPADEDHAGTKGGEVIHRETDLAPDEASAADEAAEVARLSRLVGPGDVESARGLVARLVVAFPESPKIRHWAHVLAPPTTRSRPPRRPRSFAAEHAWLREHAREYP